MWKFGTLPAFIADTQLLPGEVAVAVVGAAAVVPAVRDVTGLAFPVLVALAVHSAGGRVTGGALPVARAVIGARVDPGTEGWFFCLANTTCTISANHRAGIQKHCTKNKWTWKPGNCRFKII